jgi:mannose-1-phosphate guanylyltransferase / mannose-6-phosphate isomerase
MLMRPDEHLAAVIGLNNVVVVTGDEVVVADESQSDTVKELVERLKAERHPEATQDRRMYRPWGYYQSIDQGARYQVQAHCRATWWPPLAAKSTITALNIGSSCAALRR